MSRLGRNDRCWCNSGKKYKACHWAADQQAKRATDERHSTPLIGEMLDSVSSEYAKAKYCLHAEAGTECKGKIIHAHAIQRSGGLSRIAENGKVIDFSGQGSTILKTGKNEARLIGVNLASTFTGFCERHDDETFKPIEVKPFQPCAQHCFLHAYRAVCYQLYERQIGISHLPFLGTLSGGWPQSQQQYAQQIFRQHKAWALQRYHCTLHHKRQYDEALKSGSFTTFSYYVINLNECPDVLCSAGLFPRFDFLGTNLHNADISLISDLMTCSIIGTESGGAIVFGWLGENQVCERFIRSLLAYTDAAMMHAVVRLAFYSFKALYGSPSWWHALNLETQKHLLHRRRVGMTGQHIYGTRAYMEDNIETVGWTLASCTTNVPGLTVNRDASAS